MSLNERTSDDYYHHSRAEQERRLAEQARSREARERHVELMRLHQLRRDEASLSG
jgi:hypothetical protein